MPGTRLIQRIDGGSGAILSQTSEVVTDEELRLLAAIERLKAGRAQLRQDMQDAATFAAGSGTLNTTQLSNALRQIAAGIARTDRAILDIELVLKLQQDDGTE